MPVKTMKLSVSVPHDLLARADKVLVNPGEGRSALLTRVLDEAVRVAEEMAIDDQYDRAYRDQPVTQGTLDRTNALARAAIRSGRPPRRTRGTPI